MNTLELSGVIGLAALVGAFQALRDVPRAWGGLLGWALRLLFYATLLVTSVWLVAGMIADPAHIQPVTSVMPEWQAWVVTGFAVFFLAITGWWVARTARALRAARAARRP
ncbi:MAG TPA: hypothetical protein VF739_01440 [Ktedonobacterales bacterium]